MLKTLEVREAGKGFVANGRSLGLSQGSGEPPQGLELVTSRAPPSIPFPSSMHWGGVGERGGHSESECCTLVSHTSESGP